MRSSSSFNSFLKLVYSVHCDSSCHGHSGKLIDCMGNPVVIKQKCCLETINNGVLWTTDGALQKCIQFGLPEKSFLSGTSGGLRKVFLPWIAVDGQWSTGHVNRRWLREQWIDCCTEKADQTKASLKTSPKFGFIALCPGLRAEF